MEHDIDKSVDSVGTVIRSDSASIGYKSVAYEVPNNTNNVTSSLCHFIVGIHLGGI